MKASPLSDAQKAYICDGTWRRSTRGDMPGVGLDAHIAFYEGTGTTGRRWPLADERGSIIAITLPDGTAGSINSYDEYGQPGSGNTGTFGYTGQMWLAEAGLWHYRARAYHPTLGRFLQPDPIGYGDGFNLYAYVRNGPMNMVDPSRLSRLRPGDSTAWRECRTGR